MLWEREGRVLKEERGDLFSPPASVWPSVSSHVWEGRHFLAALITAFYIQQCWDSLVTVQAHSHVRRLLIMWSVSVCVRFEGAEGSEGGMRVGALRLNRQTSVWPQLKFITVATVDDGNRFVLACVLLSVLASNIIPSVPSLIPIFFRACCVDQISVRACKRDRTAC